MPWNLKKRYNDRTITDRYVMVVVGNRVQEEIHYRYDWHGRCLEFVMVGVGNWVLTEIHQSNEV